MDPILQWILGILSTLITGAFTAVVIPQLVKYFDAKTNNENVKAILAELGETVSTSVGYLNQTFVDQLKADGKFDPVAQQKALSDAVNEVLSGLSQKAKDTIAKNEDELKRIVIRWIEDEINKRKS